MVLDFLKNKLFSKEQLPSFKLNEGEIFTAVEDNDGHIGICAGIDKGMSTETDIYRGRVIDQALINSNVNRPGLSYDAASFIDIIPLHSKNNIVMLGFIEPIYRQMEQKKIDCKIFDFRKKSPLLSPLEEYDENISNGDTFIVTATSLSNGSFDELIRNCKAEAEIFMIGPSAPMTKYLFEYAKPLKAIFGSIVIDNKAIDAILQGAGTRTLSPFLRKASIIR
ncbi:MAG: hypothetical protein JXR53_03975 [Bacteroidales bacterium]|nr:hypothetical protein [Bacteroidales bacterium]